MTLPSVVRSGRDAVQTLHAASADAEAGHHLVEDQHPAVLVQFSRRAFEEAGLRLDQVHVAGDRFNDDAGDLAALCGEQLVDLLDVVVIEHHGMAGGVGRHAGGTRLAEGQQAGAGFHQQTVGVAVVAAFEFHQRVAAGEAARDADGAHRGFGAGGNQTQLFQAGQHLDQFLRHAQFHFGRRAEAQAQGGGIAHRLDHVGIGVPQDQRPQEPT
jgi:hypothetical protein